MYHSLYSNVVLDNKVLYKIKQYKTIVTTQCNTSKQHLQPSDPICGSIFEMFGDKWTLRIVSVLRGGDMRFKEIEKKSLY